MSAIQLKENLWSVGVLNPSLRVFDIVMEAKYGTSYNSYLLTGEKNVLIEAVHADYWDEFYANVRQVLGDGKVDYLIMNHTEPDHSGSVARVLERWPELTICCTAPAKKHLTDITNRADLPVRVVKAGDTLDLGGRTLEFIPAPMLHWADSMFTWDAAGKTLFTCDFLGCHFCEPTMLDRNVHDTAAYEGEFAYYYAGIFGPFPSYVQAGLAKMPAEADLICPSHGPCLTERIESAKAQYAQWSALRAKDKPEACVVYASAYGNTRKLAEQAEKTLTGEGFAVKVCDVTRDSLQACAAAANEADVLLVGAPTINKDAPKAVWDVLACVEAVNTRGRAAAAFGDFGWSGEAPGMLHARLGQMRFATPDKPFRVQFTPTGQDLADFGAYVSAVAALREGADVPAKPKAEKYVCKLCGYVYDPEKGDPDKGIAPGTPFDQLPADWCCPLCRVGKDMFQKES